MTYERLVAFVQNRMRMAHVYQPVMPLALLRGGGSSSTADIARSILAHDESQVEYDEGVVARAAYERVVAVAAYEDVAAAEPLEGVVAAEAADDVLALETR